MTEVFEFGVNVFESFIIFSFLTLYFGCKYKDIKAVIGFAAGMAFDILEVTYLNTLFDYEGFWGLIYTLTFFAYCYFFLNGNVYIQLFISGFLDCMIYFTTLVSVIFLSVIMNDQIDCFFVMSAERIAWIAISKALLILACLILLKFRFTQIIKQKNMIALIAMPIISMLSMVGIMEAFLQYNELKFELFLSSMGIMLANVLTYYMFITINKKIKTETELAILKQKSELDKKNAKDIEEFYNKTCGVHHDLLIHFSTISRLMEENTEKAREYIQTVTKNQLDEIKTMIKTGNDCFDAIVNTKIAVCEKYGIYCQVRIGEHTLDELSHDEIAILFGNLFDNAIEASKNSAEKTIKLDVQFQDEYISVFMKNSIDNSVLDKNKYLHTTKQNKEYHGFGTKNIKRIVEKHHGIIDYDEQDGYFICDILILT